MTPHRWEDTKRILNDALGMAVHERTKFLDAECAGDPVLRREVERLLKEAATDIPIRPADRLAEKEGSYSVGQRLGDFLFERELGSGGMGIVYLATQVSLQRKVVVKVLRSGLSLSDTQIERFRREAKATAKLRHRGIVSIQAVGEEDGVHYLAMDYNEGRSLDRILEEERKDGSADARDPERWVKLVARVADALHYAHDEGVIHRDVKPHNIIVDAEGYPHVLDFGLAKVERLSSISRSGDIAGTPYYMSPEQALAKRVRLDHRTDIFSLGCVLYELLAGVRPFEGETQQDVLFGITFRHPEPLKKHNPLVSVELQTICFKAMEKNPENRYANAKEMADDLRHYLADEAILARPPSIMRRARRMVRRRPRTALAAAFALGGIIVTMIALGAIASYRDRQKMPRLTVVSDRAGDAVYVQPLDYIGMPSGPERRIGETPIEGHRLDRGYYHIVVEREGFGFAEYVRLLDTPASALRIEARVVDREVVSRDMVPISGGHLRIGDGKAGHSGYFEREVDLPAFLIDEAEVTNREYREFCAAAEHAPPELWGGAYDPAWDDLPVVGVSYYDARAYAEWRGKRLPTIWEWERAILGKDGTASRTARLAELEQKKNANVERAIRRKGSKTADALAAYLRAAKPARDETYRQGPHGLFHMVGNVEEWTDTVVLAVRSEGGHQAQVAYRVTRGGAWGFPRVMGLRANMESPVLLKNYYLGFRCAKSARGPKER